MGNSQGHEYSTLLETFNFNYSSIQQLNATNCLEIYSSNQKMCAIFKNNKFDIDCFKILMRYFYYVINNQKLKIKIVKYLEIFETTPEKFKLLKKLDDCSQVYYYKDKNDAIKIVKEKSGNLYFGQMQNTEIKGFGYLKETSGESYIGGFKQNGKHGLGLHQIDKDKKYILGMFEYNQPKDQMLINYKGRGHKYLGTMNGKNRIKGEYHFDNEKKMVYIGSYQDNAYQGYGEFYWENGSSYKGYFENNKYHGNGKYLFKKNHDCISYEGGFNEGDYEGQGTFLWQSGKKHIGQWLNNKEDGQGFTQYKSGDTYEGNFVQGVKQGYGKYIHQSGDYYKGQFINNNYEGQGKYFWKDRNMFYEGQFVNNNHEGFGRMQWFNTGEVFEGTFKDNNMHGEGIYYYGGVSDRYDKYEGQFLDNMLHGSGKLFYKNGIIKKGKWEKDKYLYPN